MAYAALLSLTHVLQRTLKYDCPYLLPGEEQQIESLLKKVVYLQDFLDNFPRENVDSIEGLERNISDAAYQTEDIIESCVADRVLEESASRSGDIFTTSFHEIAKLIEEVDSIKTRAEKIEDENGIQEDLEQNTSLPVGSLRPDSWGQSTIVGLDDALAEIKDRLVTGSSKLDVVSIVGMGGIGKTTLAHKIYIDNYIEYHFHICAWLTVSQDYCVREILLGLLDSMKIQIDGKNGKDIDQLGELLYKNLKGRRYFFVMDDVWDIEAWDGVKRYVPEDRNGSRILLTTRLEYVASYINSGSPLLRVRFLKDEESWNLFCQKVFGEGCCPLELEGIGKQITQNCRGLPLAVVVIGGLLSKATKTPHYWRSIAENLSSEITSNDEQCSKILSLSYKHLPYHLKGCFLYMGIFPEDFEIKVEVLTKLWVAEGILKPACSKTLEDVGEEYFLDLVRRSLILVQRKGSNGQIKTCRIHDLLRDLCVREAQKENFFHVMRKNLYDIYEGIGNSMRRVSIHVEKNSRSLSDRVQFYYRLFICRSSFQTKWTLPRDGMMIRFRQMHNSISIGYSSIEVCFNSRPLKVLHMEEIRPHLKMEELVNLRYIYNKFPQKSTVSIYKLRNLQIIVSLDDYEYIKLPPEIWKMPQLRHVKLNGHVHLPDPVSSEIKGEENSILVLENLQTLSKIYNFSWTEEVLKRIPNLQKLAIHYDSIEADSWEKYCINNLVGLAKLESLKCCLRFSFPCFLVHITFPMSLKMLTLDGVRFYPQDYLKLYPEELTILGKVPNLEVLKLKNCAFNGRKWEPNEGEFLKLKFLLLDNIYLKHWRANSIHFPRLERLVISVQHCKVLDKIPSGFGEISTLQSIELINCGDSILRSAKRVEEKQLDWGNDTFKLYIKT